MKISRYLVFSKKVLAKCHENRLRIDWEIGEKHALQINVTSTWPRLIRLMHQQNSTYIYTHLPLHSANVEHFPDLDVEIILSHRHDEKVDSSGENEYITARPTCFAVWDRPRLDTTVAMRMTKSIVNAFMKPATPRWVLVTFGATRY